MGKVDHCDHGRDWNCGQCLIDDAADRAHLRETEERQRKHREGMTKKRAARRRENHHPPPKH